MSDEHFYTMVAEELRMAGPISGLWTKAFAEAEGNEPKAKALYLRYRAEQLAEAESSAILARQAANHARDLAELRREEIERKEQAKAEGFTPMHGVLVGLVLLFVGLFIWRVLWP